MLLFVVGDVLGAGINTLVGEVATEARGALWLALLVALGMALLTAASYVELVTRFPRPGGAAVFAHRAFGRVPIVLPVLGLVACLALSGQQEVTVWLRAGPLLLPGSCCPSSPGWSSEPAPSGGPSEFERTP